MPRSPIIAFAIDELPPSRNVQDRKHWRFTHDMKNRWKFLIQEKIGTDVQAIEPCDITVTFRVMREMDGDNKKARLKIPLDALQRAGVISNDNEATIGDPVVKQEIVKHLKDQGTQIEIIGRTS